MENAALHTIGDPAVSKAIEYFCREVFSLPGSAGVEVGEISGDDAAHGPSNTGIRITYLGRTSLYTFAKPPRDIRREDVAALKESVVEAVVLRNPVTGRLLRLLGWWSIFAGSFVVFGVCPICGAVGCPVGIGVTGILAGALAGVKEFGLQAVRFAAKELSLIKSWIGSRPVVKNRIHR